MAGAQPAPELLPEFFRGDPLTPYAAIIFSTSATRSRRWTGLDSTLAPAGAKVLSKPVHLRDLVAEVEKMMAA